jgi:CRISPR type III-B/RAMP module RAMP protein Cmr1
MSIGMLRKVGTITARLITPLWIGGYNASTYSSILDLVESIRPYEIKGSLRWMLRISAFSALYEKTGSLKDSQIKAIRFVESILGKASDKSGRSSIYILRVETPEGGVLPRDLEIQYNGGKSQNFIVRSWPRKLYELLRKSMEIIESRDRSKKPTDYKIRGRLGVTICSFVYSNEHTKLSSKEDNILLPLPFIDVDLDRNYSQYLDQSINAQVRNDLIEILESILKSMENYIDVIDRNRLELKRYLIGKNILRYQLELPGDFRNRSLKLFSVGDPRTRLLMLGKDTIRRPERIFMIPPGVKVAVDIYRRNIDIEIGNRILSQEEVSVLDEIIVRSLSLVLLIKGIGKAVNRGYGSFEIAGLSDRSYSLEIIRDPCDIKKEIGYIKESIYNIMTRREEEIAINPMSMDHSTRDPQHRNKVSHIYIGFINGFYEICKSVPFEINDIPNAISMINYLVLYRSNRDIDKRCMAILGLPRKHLSRERIPSLIRFRIIRCDDNRYCILVLSYLVLKESIMKGYKSQIDQMFSDEINSCIRQVFDKICMMKYEWLLEV